MGVSGAGMTQALETYRPVFMAVTFGFLGFAFYLTYRPRHAAGGTAADCGGPAVTTGKWRFNMMTMNKVMLWAVTAIAVVFLFFPQYVTGLFAEDTEITADMTRMVLRVEGMTCEG